MVQIFQKRTRAGRVGVQTAAWMMIIIYLVGPFHVQICTASSGAETDVSHPVDQAPPCCPNEDGEASAPPSDCTAEGDCCIEISSEPPTGTLQDVIYPPLSPPSISAITTGTLPRASARPAPDRHNSPGHAPPSYLVLEVLRR